MTNILDDEELPTFSLRHATEGYGGLHTAQAVSVKAFLEAAVRSKAPSGERKDLSFAVLPAKGGDLVEADLRRAILRNVSFACLDLTGVRFEGADLSFSKFQNANLSGADFTGANLTGASFDRAALAGTRFAQASLGNCVLANCDLRGCDFRGAYINRVALKGAALAPIKRAVQAIVGLGLDHAPKLLEAVRTGRLDDAMSDRNLLALLSLTVGGCPAEDLETARGYLRAFGTGGNADNNGFAAVFAEWVDELIPKEPEGAHRLPGIGLLGPASLPPRKAEPLSGSPPILEVPRVITADEDSHNRRAAARRFHDGNTAWVV